MEGIIINQKLLNYMKTTNQTEGQTVYQHGKDVSERQKELFEYFLYDIALKNQYRNSIIFRDLNIKLLIKKNIESKKLWKIYTYGLYHDCGKYLCQNRDEKGQHFPNHENVSYKLWMEEEKDEFIGELIKNDMIIHRSNKIELEQNIKNMDKDKKLILIITSIAEIHSNAEMFGGINTENFKIKFGKLEKNIKTIIKSLDE